MKLNMLLKNNMKDSLDTALRTRPDPHNTQFIEAMATYHFIRDLTRNKRVLDAGCGFGYGANYLGEYADEIVGVDLSQKALYRAKNNYQGKNIKFVLSDITELSFSDRCFDAVCLFEVIHQVKEYQKLLKEICRVLKEEGLLLISTRQGEEGKSNPDPFHIHIFTAKELGGLLLKFGFDNIQMYGLNRPQEAYRLEKELKNIRKFDLLGFKRLIPRRLISLLVYLISKAKGITPPQNFKYENFVISKSTVETSPGILAICRKTGSNIPA